MRQNLLRRENIYLSFVVLIGAIIFAAFGNLTFYSLQDWVLGYGLIGATLVLIHYIIVLPPEGNALSMDSAIYLASLFVFGLETTLTILLYCSFIHFSYERNIHWLRHAFNFAIYCMMISSAYYVFTLSGGIVGDVEVTMLPSYLLALFVYFVANVLLIGIFFWIKKRQNFIYLLKGMLVGTVEAYSSTLLLSLVLGRLLQEHPIFGLSLFVSITILLSFIFRQHFELYKEISNKANIDHLTGLKNHGYFKEVLSEKMDEVKRTKGTVSLAMLDIDDFKKYNDSYGHLKGDHLLQFFGELIEKECNEKEYIVARYGGEEFVILMSNTNESEAKAFIDCLRKKVNDTYFEGVELLPYGCLSFSAGIIEWNQQILNSSEFLSHADQAMYYAKAQGKNNTHIYGKEIDSISIEEPMEEMEQQLKLFLARDVYTYRHSKRVFMYAVEFSKKIELEDYERKILMLGALIHDIGKLEVPREVINKKGKLTQEEWELIKMHVIWGRDIVSVNKKFLDIVPLVELHHERYDGRGYPHGLKGEEIPKLARILCIIDSFDAMTTERPYQKTKSFEEAIDELRACAGTQFDPFYVEGFIDYIKEKIQKPEELVSEKKS
ncbi:diguanylate cyclase [Aquibacillus salsiterrae]|uniref:Diguanylate cyclase n=1 Tax=Aquibacillus salsiterrae TaxID=2950439 RepID=A0A9X4AFB7_9BACI|nr:diguanylate cyclase [Aquibacillus salsiterrae]MDC3417701.1 diguanylate cyclase [Aquibacillus salsiterrae]